MCLHTSLHKRETCEGTTVPQLENKKAKFLDGKTRVRAVMVGSGKYIRVGNGSGRERESRVYFVPDSDFPTPSRPWSLFPPSTAPTCASCSRPDCFPSRRQVRSQLSPSRRPPSCSHFIPTFAQSFSHPATHCSGRCSHPMHHRLN